LERTQLVDMQKAFYQLIEQQTKTAMLADVRDDYVFSVIDRAVVPQERSEPKRSLILMLGVVLGGMFGVVVTLVNSMLRKN